MKTMSIALLMVLAVGCNKDEDLATDMPSVGKPVEADIVANRPLRGITAGQNYWAVYVYAGQPGAEIDKAVGRLVSMGYGREEFTQKELACQDGAVQALNMKPESLAVSLYFGDESAARTFAQHVAAPLANVVRIKYMCE